MSVRSRMHALVVRTSLVLALLTACGDDAPEQVPVDGDVEMPDTSPPTWPPGNSLAASQASTTSVDLSWSAAVDDVGVTHYQLYVDGVVIATVPTNQVMYTAVGLGTGDSHTFKVDAGDAAGNWSTDGPSTSAVTLPPDPMMAATPVETTVPTTVAQSTSFLYEGPDPIQKGVAPGTILAGRVAVLRGMLRSTDGAPLPGATVTVLDHPELGFTLSRADGAFDMAVNGGGPLTLRFHKGGHLPVSQQVDAPWQDFATLPTDVVMTRHDSQVTMINMAAMTDVVAARGSMVTDSDGARQAAVLFTPGTAAEMVMADGTRTPLPMLSVRATEFTVGERGVEAMPGTLPPQTAFTYAAELSIDEAEAAGAISVEFSQPVFFYLDNFLNFPVGSAVPAGYLDRERGEWVPAPNGLVIKIVSITSGRANLDTNGDGAIDNDAILTTLGVTAAERTQLAADYPAGKTLWRVGLRHFTPWDCNWPYGPPPTATPPTVPPPRQPPPPNNCKEQGSIIGCEAQTLGELISIAGTPYALHYDSARAPGRTDTKKLDVPLTGSTIPASLEGIELEIEVAGQKTVRTLTAAPNASFPFTWDGLDAYGRKVQGAVPVHTRIGYTYEAVYQEPANFSQAFAAFSGTPITGNRARNSITLWQDWSGELGGFSIWSPKDQGVAGWTLDVHHVYSAATRTLFLGTGDTLSSDTLPNVVTTIAGNGAPGAVGDGGAATSAQLGSPGQIALGPDGAVYIAQPSSNRIRRVGADGVIRTVAGNGAAGSAGDAGDALLAQLNGPSSITVGANGSLYVADTNNHRIRRITPAGIISTVAGNGSPGFSGDTRTGTLARLNGPLGVSAAKDGSLYIADTNNHRIRRITPDGFISTVAGSSSIGGFGGDGAAARSALFNAPQGVAVGLNGEIFIADTANHRIRRLGFDGIITTIAGNGTGGFVGDTGPALGASLLNPTSLVVAPDGSLLIADTGNHRVRRISIDGTITTIAGVGSPGFSGDDGPAVRAHVAAVAGLAVTPDGVIYASDRNNHRIRRVSPALPGVASVGEQVIPSGDGTELYVFDSDGVHLKTLDAFTGKLRNEFSYDTGGRLTKITDRHGNAVEIQRNAAGEPTQIVAPGGQQTQIAMAADGWLSEVTAPDGTKHVMTYGTGGLLATFVDARGSQYRFTYDTTGRLVRDEGPDSTKTLARTSIESGSEVTVTTVMGRATTYRTEQFPSGDLRRQRIDPSGAITSTVVKPDGTTVVTQSDGTTVTMEYAPDPRWGLAAPYPKNVAIATPSSLRQVATMSRTVVLANANPLSLLTMTDRITVNGRQATMIIDTAASTVTHTSPAGRTTVTTLDMFGDPIRETRQGITAPFEYAYDSRGRRTLARHGAASIATTYDPSNRVASTRDAANYEQSYTYDTLDRIRTFTWASGRSLGFTHDVTNGSVAVAVPGGATHVLEYTRSGELSTHTLPASGGTYRWTFDADHRSANYELPDGRDVLQGYDTSGRLISKQYPEATVAIDYVGMSDRWNSATRTPATGSSQTTSFTYDGHLLTGAALNGAANGAFTYAYDANHDLASVAFAGGSDLDTQTLVRDLDGLVTVRGPFTYVLQGPEGAPSAVSDSTLSLAFRYDTMGRRVGRTVALSGVDAYAVDVELDSARRIVKKTETIGTTPTAYAYTYDADGQLLSVTKDGAPHEAYQYDVRGNRTSRVAPGISQETTAYDAQDHVTTRGAVAYAYDTGGFVSGIGTSSFDYSARGELLEAATATKTVTYSYDVLGRVVARHDGTETLELFYGDEDAPTKVTHSRDVTGLTVYHHDDNGNLYAFQRAGTRYYVASDHVGTPRLVFDGSGAVVKQIEYDSWGRVLSDSAPSFALLVGFAGGIADVHSGLVRFGWRDYDPETGRWTARDPVLFDGGETNLYLYARNNPVSLKDSLGTWLVGFSAYSGVGGGGSISYGPKGLVVCGEVGVGIGGSLTVDPFAPASDPGTSINASLSVGPVGVSISQPITTGSCPVDGPTVSVSAGYVSGSYQLGGGLGPPGVNLADAYGSKKEVPRPAPKLKVQASATVSHCKKLF